MTIRSTLAKLTLAAVTLTATAVLFSANDTADARGYGGGGYTAQAPGGVTVTSGLTNVRDHRVQPTVRDHRAQPTVRDHRAQPIVRDHRPGARRLCQTVRCR